MSKIFADVGFLGAEVAALPMYGKISGHGLSVTAVVVVKNLRNNPELTIGHIEPERCLSFCIDVFISTDVVVQIMAYQSQTV